MARGKRKAKCKAKPVRVNTSCAGGQSTAVAMSIASSPYLVDSEKRRSRRRNGTRARLLNAFLIARVKRATEESAAPGARMRTSSKGKRREGSPFDVLWLSGSDSCQRDALRLLGPTQRMSRFPGAIKVSEKVCFSALMERNARLFPRLFDFVPRTWVLPRQLDEVSATLEINDAGRSGRIALRKRREAAAEAAAASGEDVDAAVAAVAPADPSLPPKTRTFIVKPSRGLQGKGIYLAQRPADLRTCAPPSALRAGLGPDAAASATSSHASAVVQDYVDDPLTIEGRKFDLRLYMLLRSVDPPVAYLCDEGMVRLCAEEYSKPNRKNMKQGCMHLTNYAINKKHADFDGAQSGQSGPAKDGSAAASSDDVRVEDAEEEEAEEEGKEGARGAKVADEEGEPGEPGTTGCKRTLTWLWEHLTETHGAEAVATLQARLKQITYLTAVAVAPPLACVYRETVHAADMNAVADEVALATQKKAGAGATSPWDLWKRVMASKRFAQHSTRIAKHSGSSGCGKRGQKSRCFQIMGLDIVLDQDLKPWLLELNARPSLSLLRPAAAKEAAVSAGESSSAAPESPRSATAATTAADSAEAEAAAAAPPAQELSAVDVAIKVPMIVGALHVAASASKMKKARKRGLRLRPRKVHPAGGGTTAAAAAAAAADDDPATAAWKRVSAAGSGGERGDAAMLDVLLRCCQLFFRAVQDAVGKGKGPLGLSGANLRAIAPQTSSGATLRGRNSAAPIASAPGLLGRESFCRFVRRTGLFSGIDAVGGGLMSHRVDLVWIKWSRVSEEARALGIGTGGHGCGIDPLAFCDFLESLGRQRYPELDSGPMILERVLLHCAAAEVESEAKVPPPSASDTGVIAGQGVSPSSKRVLVPSI